MVKLQFVFSHHGWPWSNGLSLFLTMVNHGQSSLTMVDHSQPWSTIVNNGDHGWPWSTMLLTISSTWYLMVDHVFNMVNHQIPCWPWFNHGRISPGNLCRATHTGHHLGVVAVQRICFKYSKWHLRGMWCVIQRLLLLRLLWGKL